MKSRNFFFSFLMAIGFFLTAISPAYAYAIRRGDTLSLLAKRYNVPLNQLINANRIKNPNLIYVGQPLTIPKTQAEGAQVKGVWVEVSLKKQKLYLYQGGRILFQTSVSTGLARYPTPTGSFRIWTKLQYDDMSGGSRARGDYYYLPKVPHVAYFYKGYALHGTYWHKNFGHPMSHGCINLSIPDAHYVYSQITVGTPVIVRS